MKIFAVFVMAMVLAVANVQAAVQPYVVPIYRVTKDATTTTLDPTATTTTTQTTTPTTTTPTTTVSVETTPTTTQKTTLPALLDTNIFEVKEIRHPRSLLLVEPVGMSGYTFVHVCSGTLVDDTAVITSVTCIDMAMEGTEEHPYVGTAADTSSADAEGKVLYEVESVVKHSGYNSDTNVNNIAVLKLAKQVVMSKAGKVSQIPWSMEVVAVDTDCVTSFWSVDSPFAQVNQGVKVKACNPAKDGAICSDYPTPPEVCPAGSNGASLVCDSKLAGIFTAHRNADCNAALWQYEEVSKDADWIGEAVGSATVLKLSFAAILALVTAMLKSL